MNDYINITCEDNMKLMARYPDNHFDLAIVDPPYGLDKLLHRSSYGSLKNGALAKYGKNRWDVEPPKEYWIELKRVSKNQIIWGGNYFANNLKNSRCWVCWNKDNPAKNFSSLEFAYTSFDRLPAYFYYAWGGLSEGIKGRNKKEKSIHPTQKPIALYKWLLTNYAKPGDKILDTHIGSGSIAIAVDSVNKIEKMSLTLTGCELDPEYYKKAMERIKEKTAWQCLF